MFEGQIAEHQHGPEDVSDHQDKLFVPMVDIHPGGGGKENRRDAEAEDQERHRNVGKTGALSQLEDPDNEGEIQQVLRNLRQNLSAPESVEVGVVDNRDIFVDIEIDINRHLGALFQADDSSGLVT